MLQIIEQEESLLGISGPGMLLFLPHLKHDFKINHIRPAAVTRWRLSRRSLTLSDTNKGLCVYSITTMIVPFLHQPVLPGLLGCIIPQEKNWRNWPKQIVSDIHRWANVHLASRQEPWYWSLIYFFPQNEQNYQQNLMSLGFPVLTFFQTAAKTKLLKIVTQWD